MPWMGWKNGFALALLLLAASQVRSQNVPAQVFNTPDLPIRLASASFENLEHRSDFNYSVENLTDDGIWNFQVSLFFLDSNRRVQKKLDICVEWVIKGNDEKCRYYPPGSILEARKSEEIGVILDERVEPGTTVVATVSEVRGEKGIWRRDDSSLRTAVQRYAQGLSSRSPKITRSSHITIVDSDKSALVKRSLELALIKKQIPDYAILRRKQPVVVSSENIFSYVTPRLLEVLNITLLAPDEIQARADQEGDFTYLHFGDIKANGDKVFVVLLNTWVKAKNSRQQYLSGGAVFIEFQKRKGRWVGKSVGGWIS